MCLTAWISTVGRRAVEAAPEGHCVDSVDADRDGNIEISDYIWGVSEGVARTDVGVDMPCSVVC